MTSLLPLLSAFAIGFFGSVHCLGMCGGIATALGFSTEAQTPARRVWLNLSYNLGRLLTYALMGLLLGWLIQLSPHALHQNHGGVVVVRLLAGLLLIAMGLYVAGWWMGLVWIEKVGVVLWRRIQPLSRLVLPVDKTAKAVGLGLLWGWLPCGLVYSALAFAATQASPVQAGLAMFAFGLGTTPALLASGVFAVHLRQWVQARGLRQVMGLLVIFFGLWTMAGGLGLHGH